MFGSGGLGFKMNRDLIEQKMTEVEDLLADIAIKGNEIKQTTNTILGLLEDVGVEFFKDQDSGKNNNDEELPF